MITLSGVNKVLKKAVAEGMPFSSVRLGDGEWEIIKWPKHGTYKQCLSRIGRWFDVSNITEAQVSEIRDGILKACRRADLLGVPGAGDRKYLKWRGFQTLKTQHYYIEPKYEYNFYEVVNVNYRYILQGVKNITCITCRNIGDKIEQRFKLKAKMILIPRETWTWNKATQCDKTIKGTHYPDMYNDICKRIAHETNLGSIYLIGAGGLGKIYCNCVKKAGGIAIDIGALFDGWAGLKTRPYLKRDRKL